MTIFTVKGMSCGKSITNAIKTLDTAGSVAVDLAREVDIDSGENNLITGHWSLAIGLSTVVVADWRGCRLAIRTLVQAPQCLAGVEVGIKLDHPQLDDDRLPQRVRSKRERQSIAARKTPDVK